MGLFDDAFESIGQVVTSASRDIQSFGNDIANTLSSVANDAEDLAGSVASDIESLAEDAEEVLSDAASAAESLAEWVASDIEATARDAEEALSDAASVIKDTAKAVGESIEEVLQDVGTGSQDLLTRSDADNKVNTRGPVYIPSMEHLGAGPTTQLSTPDRQSRVKCNTGQYDQVVAISEEMLNAQLQNYYDVEEKMQTMSQTDPFAGNIEAKMRAPRVSIAVKDQNRSALDYHVRIESATIETYPCKIADVQAGMDMEEYEIHDWEFVFTVNIAFEGMSKEDKEKLGPTLGVAGDYSIQRLLLQFGSADISRWIKEKSHTKMDDGEDPPDYLAEKFDRWTSGWLAGHGDVENRLHGIKTLVLETVGGAKKVAGAPGAGAQTSGTPGATAPKAAPGVKSFVKKRVKTGCPILYHAMPLNPKDVNPVAPTFPPQAVTQQTYEFVRPIDGRGGRVRFPARASADNPAIKEQITRYNCLLYLETCGRELPAGLNFDETHGNFVTADGININHYPSDLTPQMLAKPQVMGSMCFKAEILFDAFLIPKFRPLVKETEIIIDSVSADANKSNSDLAFDWKYSFGGNTAHPIVDDVYFNMKKQNGTDTIWDKWFNNQVAGIKNTNGWRWSMDEMVKEDRSVEKDCWSWVAKRIWLSLTVRSLCNLQHFPGTNAVRFTGITTMALHFVDDRNCWFTADTDQVAITGVWSFDMIFKCGDSGRIEIDVQWPENPLKETNWVNPHGDHLRGISTNNIKIDMETKLKNKVNALKAHVEQIKNALKDQCFVLSGGGYFFQRNPIFTEHGDLLVELEYKGIPKDGKLNPPPPLGVIPEPPNVMPKDINEATKPELVKLEIPNEPEEPPKSKDAKDAPASAKKEDNAPQEFKDEVKGQEAKGDKKPAA